MADQNGVEPLKMGDPKFDEAIGGGQKVKWVITRTGELLFVPKRAGEDEIKHSVAAGGGSVLAAGEAIIEKTPDGKYVGLQIDRCSGHYRPREEHLDYAEKVFALNGLFFFHVDNSGRC
ncbi:hypothetical protein GCM10023085_53420 [Actinomadura viridis]|uniref:Uncharacterized protein n=1 Tax=Actinomadura viridis TaxID=58110 RepID=A0A931D8D9_9ACTN|nr:hypothetical protein [Actinomadura viridis]MBG6086309.1 hypothetical protein [Actinomadura viridis]